jgi:hypothetical protein
MCTRWEGEETEFSLGNRKLGGKSSGKLGQSESRGKQGGKPTRKLGGKMTGKLGGKPTGKLGGKLTRKLGESQLESWVESQLESWVESQLESWVESQPENWVESQLETWQGRKPMGHIYGLPKRQRSQYGWIMLRIKALDRGFQNHPETCKTAQKWAQKCCFQAGLVPEVLVTKWAHGMSLKNLWAHLEWVGCPI